MPTNAITTMTPTVGHVDEPAYVGGSSTEARTGVRCGTSPVGRSPAGLTERSGASARLR